MPYQKISDLHSTDFEPHLAESGNPLPPARHVRNNLILGGKVPNKDFTHLLTYFVVFLLADTSTVTDTGELIIITTFIL